MLRTEKYDSSLDSMNEFGGREGKIEIVGKRRKWRGRRA